MKYMDTEALRKDIIAKRRALDVAKRLRLSDMIAERLFDTKEYAESDTVLIYADYNGEVATDRIINRCFLDGKAVYAPVCGKDLDLVFYRIYALDEMEPGAYGIREPLTIEYLKLSENNLSNKSICITPGAVFDRHCNRCGYGKGYYDRFFAKMKINKRIGLAYDFQITDSIITKDTDIPMTMIITENETINGE
ncbi:MAG: 5-formyltetrahydrofolate cyclo-ligase [Lachnospiraceae bacterium]|nr:5-formyltetrahydrofolate cyclo-ligase [Lachnospiraceae bacterium]